MKRLAGRRILVTGAASGIGAATARLFHEEGASLALFDWQAQPLEDVATQTSAARFAVDLADGKAAGRVAAQAAEAMGGLDGVVNCAGVAGGGPIESYPPEFWGHMMAVNLTAPYLICRNALPWLRQAEAATIVNLVSGQALLPNAPGVTAYAASKAGLAAFTKALAAELGPQARVNAVAPGIVNTPMTAGVLGGYENPDDAPFVNQYALRRVAAPEEIAAAILFLTGPESSFVTGSILAVDGGRTFH